MAKRLASAYRPGAALARLDQGQARPDRRLRRSAAGGRAGARSARCWSACPTPDGPALPRAGSAAASRPRPRRDLLARLRPAAARTRRRSPTPLPREDAQGRGLRPAGAGGRGPVRQPDAGRPAALPALRAAAARQDARGDRRCLTGCGSHIDGRELELSNLDKVLYPEVGFTKGEIIDYYVRVAAVLLPHLRDRPLTRIRYPNGVDAASFFEKNAPGGTPSWVRAGDAAGARVDHRPGDARLHRGRRRSPPWPGWPTSPPSSCTLHSGDCDGGRRPTRTCSWSTSTPGRRPAWTECCLVAVAARHRLRAGRAEPVAKTSGKKGMQLLARVDGGRTSDEVAGYARAWRRTWRRALPELVTARMTKSLRPGKVFFDWSQNVAAKTTVSAYSLRAGPPRPSPRRSRGRRSSRPGRMPTR